MKSLIFGVGGQDGAYLAALLLSLGYIVTGTSRDAFASDFENLRYLNIKDDVSLLSMDAADFRSVLHVIEKTRPDEIYNLAGQTSVSLSFEQPVEAMESIGVATLNILEAIRSINPSIRFYNAGSGECFGNTGEFGANEVTPFKPCSPYGVAKATSYFLVQNYRLAYGLHACTGILFNHESPLRSVRFVTQKIVLKAARIAAGSPERLKLGNLTVSRDWGWAPDYVDAMWRMLQQKTPSDFVIATGTATPLEGFVAKAFSFFNLDWREHVDIETSLMRPSDIEFSKGDSKRAHEILGWKPSLTLDEIIARMCTTAAQQLGTHG